MISPELKPAPPDRTAQLRRSAYEAVAQARRVLDPNGLSNSPAGKERCEWLVFELLNFYKTIRRSEAKSLLGGFGRLQDLLHNFEDRAAKWTRLHPNADLEISEEFAETLHSEVDKGTFRVSDPRAQDRIDKFLSGAKEAVSRRSREMLLALDFLRTIANQARRKGGKVGDSPTRVETRAVINLLDSLARGQALKAIAQVVVNDHVDDARSLKRYKSLERSVSRFCRRMATAVHIQYGPKITSLDFPHLCHAIRDWQWIDPRQDRLALTEAARRGLPHLKLVSSK